MELFIIRHGEAESGVGGNQNGPPLSEKGVAEIKKVAHLVGDMNNSPTALFCSQLQRAQQTADLFNEFWGLKIQNVDWLQPGVEPSRILQELKKISEDKIALVGHLPTLGWLLSVLIWGTPPKEILVPKGSVSLVKISEWEPSGGVIQWMLNPDILTL